jgi:hypothetical protein
MPSGQFNTVVISVSDILPLDKGHYISVKHIPICPTVQPQRIITCRDTAPAVSAMSDTNSKYASPQGKGKIV